MEQLQDVHVADRDFLLERLAAAAVVEQRLPRALAPDRPLRVDEELDRRVGVLLRPLAQRLVDVDGRRAVEDRRRDGTRLAAVDDLAPVAPVDLAVRLPVRRAFLGEDAVRRGPAEVRLEYLA